MLVALKAAEQLEWPPLLWSRAPRWLVKVQGEPQRWGTFGGSLRHPEPDRLHCSRFRVVRMPLQGPAEARVCEEAWIRSFKRVG